MTTPGTDATSLWLTAQRDRLVEDLAITLDLDIGLRDVRIHTHHDSLVQDLARSLDLVAGLAAIHQPTAHAPDPVVEEPATTEEDHSLPFEQLSHRDQLTLRRHPVILEGVAEVALLEGIGLATEIAILVADRAAIGIIWRRSTAIHRLLTRIKHRGLANRAVRLQARSLAHHVSALDDGAGHPTEPREHDQTDKPVRLLLFQSTMRIAAYLAHDLKGHEFRSHRQLSRFRRPLMVIAHQTDDFADIGAARDHLVRLNRIASRLATTLTAKLEADAGVLLVRGPVPGLCTAFLTGALDDFTAANLQDVDLAGVDLAGVRWSLRGTRWPPTVDVERLMADSEETPAGSGIYVVRPGTATAEMSWA
ncbi:hypothetical protein [Kitasatospora purpeofusca]|uniref:hypothetical protein n=1 Tax=Kitasatospora purpeofusca TaxID=67352 RepID=UPI0036D3A3A2